MIFRRSQSRFDPWQGLFQDGDSDESYHGDYHQDGADNSFAP